ncbi:MAG TPA: hypothetical protein VIC84_25200, partial [Blastocatellia bacterium]
MSESVKMKSAQMRFDRIPPAEAGGIRRIFSPFFIGAIRVIVLALLAAFFGATARAQDARLQIDQLKRLADKAAEVVEVTLDERSLRLAARFLSTNNPDEAKVKEIVSGLKGVYVRVFE